MFIPQVVANFCLEVTDLGFLKLNGVVVFGKCLSLLGVRDYPRIYMNCRFIRYFKNDNNKSNNKNRIILITYSSKN